MLRCTAEEGEEGGLDDDYACAGSEADDEATLEEEDALAAQDGLDQKVCSPLKLSLLAPPMYRTNVGDIFWE